MSSVLVDGSLSNPPILLAVLLAAVLLAVIARVLIAFLIKQSPPHRAWLFPIPLALVLAFITPFTVRILIVLFMGTLFSSSVSLCLMPTNHFPRDWGPGVLGFVGGIYFGVTKILHMRQGTAA